MAYYLLTCQNQLLDSLTKHLEDGKGIVGAWLCACQELPCVKGLEQLKGLHPTALPSWLAGEAACGLLAQLEVRPGNHVVFKKGMEKDTQARAAEREAQLEGFRRCRFQEGFASEGMLCNSPPLPLRVLDYLEAADLLSLSLVCKATHRASHYLFHREEELLNRQDIQVSDLQPIINSAAARHRTMRVASLMCGRPEALDVTIPYPILLRYLVASPAECTQRHVRWRDFSPVHRTGLTRIMEGRRVYSLGRGTCVMYRVDPGRSVSQDPLRDDEAISHLVCRPFGSSLKWRVNKCFEEADKVFKTACKRHQVAFVFKDVQA